jgi:hypothetical protein
MTIQDECLICVEKYNKHHKRKVLPCNHEMCSICASLQINQERLLLKCPFCRREHNIALKFDFVTSNDENKKSTLGSMIVLPNLPFTDYFLYFSFFVLAAVIFEKIFFYLLKLI